MTEQKIIERLTEELEIALAENAKIKEQLEEKWISVKDRLPEIDFTKPEYDRRVNVVCCNEKSGHVRGLRYASNGYAKTEKGRAPRFEEYDGRIAFMEVTHWMPMPRTKEIEYGK